MFRTYKMGVGMVVITKPADDDAVIQSARTAGVNAWLVGRTVHGTGQVNLV